MSGQPIFSNATLDDTDVNKPVFSSLEAKKISDYSPTYSSIAVNGGKIEVTFISSSAFERGDNPTPFAFFHRNITVLSLEDLYFCVEIHNEKL